MANTSWFCVCHSPFSVFGQPYNNSNSNNKNGDLLKMSRWNFVFNEWRIIYRVYLVCRLKFVGEKVRTYQRLRAHSKKFHNRNSLNSLVDLLSLVRIKLMLFWFWYSAHFRVHKIQFQSNYCNGRKQVDWLDEEDIAFNCQIIFRV